MGAGPTWVAIGSATLLLLVGIGVVAAFGRMALRRGAEFEAEVKAPSLALKIRLTPRGVPTQVQRLHEDGREERRDEGSQAGLPPRRGGDEQSHVAQPKGRSEQA